MSKNKGTNKGAYVPTVYVRDNTTRKKLGSDMIITNGVDKKYNFEEMQERLQGFVNFLIEKKDDKGLALIHNELIGGKIEFKNLEEIRDKIFPIIKELRKTRDSVGMKKLHEIMLGVANYKKKATDIGKDDPTFYNLSSFSKKKYLFYKLKEKHPELDKKGLKELIRKIVVLGYDEELLTEAYDSGLDPIYYNIGMYFKNTSANDMNNLIKFSSVTDEEAEDLLYLMRKSSKVSPKTIEKIEDAFWLAREIKPDVTSSYTETIQGETISEISEILSIERKQIADFNPFLLDLTFEIGYKELGLDRFIEIYEKLFSNIAGDILEDIDGIKPSFNAFRRFESAKINPELNEKEKSFTYQHLIEFPIPKEFDIKNLKDLAVLLNEEIGGINLYAPEKNQSFKHPLSTIEGKTKYSGFFGESGEKFLDSNIIIQEGENDEKLVRLTLGKLSQDEFIYLITQIGYYIKNGNFVDKKQLYFDIYDRYNSTLFDNELFDISVLGDKYESFVKDLVIPFTKEGIKLNLKADNTLLAGLYGTSKSQFLLHLLLDKKWVLNGREFLLNATTIPIGLQEFKALLMQGLGGIKTRLDKIFSRTGVPIILIVEDLDTLVNEKLHGVNDEIAQAMTLFFEGLGSLPVTVVTTSNDPTKFSERLIRPNRLSKIKIFNRPSIDEKKLMLKNHLERKQIDLSDPVLNSIYGSDVFKEGTASHIGEIVKEIFNYIKIQKEIFDKNPDLSKNITSILENIPISKSDIIAKEKSIKQWYKNISGVETDKIMGFKTK